MPKISYLVTCSNETDTLKRLLEKIVSHLGNDQLVILQDDTTHHQDTDTILHRYSNQEIRIQETPDVILCQHKLDANYGAHKNYGIEKCNGDFILQIDGDEMLPDSLLGENLHALLESNPEIEAYAVPRINDFRGVTQDHANTWGWRLSESPSLKRPIVNFPDYQWRIFKRDFPRIGFTRRLHEKIEGYNKFVALPAIEDYAIYHDKTIDTQLKTNLRYNQVFSVEDNKGHGVFR